jgi:hypothetical protein
MGVDCKIHIPADVKLRDLEVAMGVAAGFCKEKKACGNSFYVKIEGVKVKGSEMFPMCPTIVLEQQTLDKITGHHVMYHLEDSETHGKFKLLMPRSTPFWIAMGVKLVTIFGGYIDYNDCDEIKSDFKRKKPRKFNDPGDGVEWEELQQALWDIKPITQEDLVAVRGYASYDTGIEDGLDSVAKVDKKKKASQEFDDVSDKIVANMFEDN